MIEGVLAPTNDQRLKYADWLHVYAKDRTEIPRRMKTLLRDYNVCLFLNYSSISNPADEITNLEYDQQTCKS